MLSGQLNPHFFSVGLGYRDRLNIRVGRDTIMWPPPTPACALLSLLRSSQPCQRGLGTTIDTTAGPQDHSQRAGAPPGGPAAATGNSVLFSDSYGVVLANRQKIL